MSDTVKRSEIGCRMVMARLMSGRVITCGVCDWCMSLPPGPIRIEEDVTCGGLSVAPVPSVTSARGVSTLPAAGSEATALRSNSPR